MLNSFLDWFKKEAVEPTEQSTGSVDRAAAALMVEVVMADDQFNDEEKAKLPALLKAHTGLTTQECLALIKIAETEVDHATSLHQFTRHLNESFDIDQKLSLVFTLWSIAFADGHLDRYEVHIIRKISDLLHLRHSEFMKMKVKAQNAQ
ncbi:MAG: putative tellurite resistance protein B-like protein [Bermanella sp.]|jgi:uncharacterized tellurite resistance protein B-like protein